MKMKCMPTFPELPLMKTFLKLQCLLKNFLSNQATASKSPSTISQALQYVFDDVFLSDFTLRIKDRVFPVHRSILGIRSPGLQSDVRLKNERKSKQLRVHLRRGRRYA